MATGAWLVRVASVLAFAACDHSHAASPVDATAPDAAPPAPVLGVFGLCSSGWSDTPFAVGTGNPFVVTACAAGDVAVIQVGCATSNAPSAVSVASPGWTITQIGPIVGSADAGLWAASFGAVVPAAEEAWFMVQWDGAECAATWDVGDDLQGADGTAGSAAFDAHAEAVGAGNVGVVIETGHANDIIWFAGASRPGPFGGLPTGCDFGMSDGDNDLTFYKYTSAPANTPETFGFRGEETNTTLVTAVSVRPRSASVLK